MTCINPLIIQKWDDNPINICYCGQMSNWSKYISSASWKHCSVSDHPNTVQFSSVQSLSCVWLFATPWIAARQASLSIANSQNLLKLPEFTQTHAHRVSDAIQPSHPLSSPSPPAPNPSQHQGLFQWVNSSHQVAKVLEFQLQHQSFQWTPRTYLRDISLPTKVHLVKAMVFPVVMYGCELDCEESWVPKNWFFWTIVLEKTLENPLGCKEIQPVHPNTNTL